ncbi:mannose-1-phosphate guanylyltransferase [Paenibacillus baekrokdamisoli]|uniref:Mannose-1-phosphate guanylyltransferase n=1 Tax=Paenibacillus baekrokdamisoli TaxID=1712516 RepID=A0A3G9ITK3_9BACL|nr:sugar phosphate nucleotidyltransferase [Paenibacillus baekrokdamisoli]MBB3073047.1 mannose-1-phosphate guanylyltransferase [Paenibacillus baekrokdamisoli]BBH21716.1 mannose-1-phosphate guanylyltransferase [Paenibacillus baekrokdamisoli]
MNIVIMAGGKGTRFWPRSVDNLPKQFLNFHSQQTLIQETAARFQQLVSADHLFIASPERYLPLLDEQLPLFPKQQLIVEPEQKDTAACIALAAFQFLNANNDEAIVFVPSDQHVANEPAFLHAIKLAADTAEMEDAIVTLGITPSRPEVGFGYLKTAESSDHLPPSVLQVVRFLEKPSEERARQLLQEPGMYWNSGIFVCRPSTIARCIQLFQPDIWNSLLQYPLDPAAAYALMPKLSIDYAVMEKVETMYCIPVDCGWDDIGSWAAVSRHSLADVDSNVSQGTVSLIGSTGNTVFTDDDKQVLIIGVHDLIIVSTSNGLLICSKTEEPRLKTWLNQTPR